VLATVVGEVAVVVVDHRDARAHEPRDGEDGDSRAEGEGSVGVAQVKLARRRLAVGLASSAGGRAAEVDASTARVREQDLVP
jgi:hypothetical protein